LVPYLSLGFRPAFGKAGDATGVIPQPAPGDAAGRARYVAGYGAFCGATAARYRGRVPRYSVGNEPNNRAFVYPVGAPGSRDVRPLPPGLYGDLYRACRAAIVTADPAATVAFGELAAPGCAYARAALAGSPVTVADALAIHPYQFDVPPTRRVPDRCAGIARLRDWREDVTSDPRLRTPAGGPVPLAVTEFGYWAPGAPRFVPGDPDDGPPGPNTRAAWIARAYAVARAAGATVFSYYHLVEAAPGATWNSGIVRADGSATPAVGALRGASPPAAGSAWAGLSPPAL
jgi:hypothetical protein